MGLEQSMQVFMATLRVATTWHRHTDRVSGDTYHPVYLALPMKVREVREEKHSTMVLRANYMFAHSWQPKHISPAKPCIRLHRTLSPQETAGQR